MTSDTQAVFEYVRTLVDRGFYGFVTLKFEAGEAVHVREERNLRPTEIGNRQTQITNELPRRQGHANGQYRDR